jgi:hypothetical protein
MGIRSSGFDIETEFRSPHKRPRRPLVAASGSKCSKEQIEGCAPPIKCSNDDLQRHHAMKDTATPSKPADTNPTRNRAPERNTDYALYKPNSRGSGGAIRFGLNVAKGAVFLEAAPQSGEKHFDWEQKIIMKWGLADIGAALAVLEGRTTVAKLFHQSEKANSAFEFSLRDDPDRAPLLLSVSRQDAADKSLRKVTIPVSHAEAAVLETALRTAVARILRW